MTEQDWLTCELPDQMLNFLGKRASPRKLRLFACACCRRVWPWLSEGWGRDLVHLAEQLAEGKADEVELAAHRPTRRNEQRFWRDRYGTMSVPTNPDSDQAAQMARAAAEAAVQEDPQAAAREAVIFAVRTVLNSPIRRGVYLGWDCAEQEYRAQTALLRDIFGNPFRTVEVEPTWRHWESGVILRLARSIHDERAFEQMPVLGDALEEAGCQDQAILAHCRFSETHVPGCWVLDALLEKR